MSTLSQNRLLRVLLFVFGGGAVALTGYLLDGAVLPSTWAAVAIVATVGVLSIVIGRGLEPALVRFHTREAADARAALRRETALRGTAAKMLTTHDPAVVREAVTQAGQAVLGVGVGLVTLPDARERPEHEVNGEVFFRLIPSGEHTTITVRGEEDLPRESITWLEDMGRLASSALERCAAYERVRYAEEQLHTGLDVLPAPFAISDSSNRLLFANEAFKNLGLEDVLVERSDLGEDEQEVAVGDPARVFMATQLPLGDGHRKANFFREVSREHEAMQAKEQMIAFVGHELRNPLASIRGYHDLMARHLRVVEGELTDLNRLVADFMEASRTDVRTLALERQSLDAIQVARTAFERFFSRKGQHPLHLDVVQTAPVEGDPGRLVEVIENLLDNAAKYSLPDGPITLRVSIEGDEVLISVADLGAGIAADDLLHIFEASYRAEHRVDGTRGFGLGLSIVHELVSAHGGRTWAESEGLERGSTVWVSLPLRVSGVGNQSDAV